MKHFRKTQLSFALLSFVLVLHAVILGYGSYVNSPAKDEVGHLTAGLSHLELRKFDLYRVNPPLVRSLAAIPLWLSPAERDWSRYLSGHFSRPEFPVGMEFISNNGPTALRYFTLGRFICVPFSILTAILCFVWAKELFGLRAGVLAAMLWCFLPEAIGNGQMITPDCGATALGLAFWYAFYRWLRQPSWPQSLVATVLLGLAVLTKTTWLIAYPTAFLVWAFWTWWSEKRFRSTLLQLATIVLASIYFINLGYLFEGSGKQLGEYTFVSTKLSGETSTIPGNRFAGTWVGRIPVPLPENFVRGIDLQKYEFDEGQYDSFLRGTWQKKGWWYYYAYALAIKTPLGCLILFVAASLALLTSPFPVVPTAPNPTRKRGTHRNTLRLAHASGYDSRSGRLSRLVPLLLPGLVVFIFVSSQTGFSHHLRYVLPAMPYLLVLASSVVAKRCRSLREEPYARPSFRSHAIVATTCWTIASSLFVVPFSPSYFNELIGGPTHGSSQLHNSNVDWGQDTLRVLKWRDRHPEIDDFFFAHHCNFPLNNVAQNADWKKVSLNPMQPGWYAMSVNQLNRADDRFAIFRHFRPVGWIGYSTRLYQLTEPDIVQAVRKQSKKISD